MPIIFYFKILLLRVIKVSLLLELLYIYYKHQKSLKFIRWL